jgi:uncharacterized surface protein with fasciclin (FAS1) repeats
MRNLFKKAHAHPARFILLLVLLCSAFVACKDPYYYDDYEPEWLGSNIYDYLKEDGHFNYTLKLIDSLDYTDVMKLTGSITLFVAKDSAYDEFFKNNEWGVKKFEDLTTAQKKLLFNFSIINNAFLTETLVNYFSNNTYFENQAMRRETALSALDSIPFESGSKLPENDYWNTYRKKGLYIMKDASIPPTVYFTQEFLNKNIITNDDFNVFSGGQNRTQGDVHIFNVHVIKKDIVCKNGYVNILNSVLIPPKNMAEYIKDNPDTKIFSKLLDRFCLPVYDATMTSNYRDLMYKNFKINFTDSIFAKKYLATNGGTTRLPSGLTAPNLLAFDPGWNAYYASSSSLQADMAAIFVPSDEAMTEYFNSGVGDILKSQFGSWDNVPDNIIIPFLKRHMRTSFIESVPSRFGKMVDPENYRLPVEKSHIEDTYTGVNGQVYVTNAVYPPVDYISVYSPVLLSSNSKIFKWAIDIEETSKIDNTKFAFYRLYLNSLVSKYSLFVPTDEYFTKYIDPIAYGQDGTQGVLKFWFNTKTSSVNASVYRYEKATGIVGDSVGVISDATFLKNRLWNMLDNHIVVGDVESGGNYFVTKGNDLIKVEGTGTSMTVQGGLDIEHNGKAHVTRVFRQDNGSTYFIDKPIQSTLNSVYNVLGTTPQFSMFYSLLSGVPDTCVSQIFSQQGVDFRVSFFNAFRYTIYVPTNEAIQNAIDKGVIMPWETIYKIKDPALLNESIQKMIRFLRYHFQDNAVFFGQNTDDLFQSATLKTDYSQSHFGTAKDKYYKIGVQGTAGSMTLTTENNMKAHVVTTDGLYNIIAKDYIFAKIPSSYKNVDGTGSTSGALFSSSSITTSASTVIHQIDNVLTFQ